MSSSNRVRITAIEETVLGTTPGAGNFETVRYISESLSGSPETTESEQIRSDRQSNGQVLTSIQVGGDLNFELAKETVVNKFLESAMLSSFSTSSPVTVNLAIDASLKTLTRASGSFVTDNVVVGDVLTLAGFASALNNVQVMVASVSALTLTILAPSTIVTAASTPGTSFQRADKIAIGTTKKSFSIEKKFEDLTTKGFNYKGMLVNTFNLAVSYGEILKGKFGFSGTGYEQAYTAGELITNGRTINSAATTNSMNGSVDMPFIGTNLGGVLADSGFCIQSVEIDLNNNLSAQNCIGILAPTNYSAGTAKVSVNLSTYLADANWLVLAKKLDQTSFSLGFQVKNADGWFAFYMPAVQVNFDDGQVPGANQEIILTMSGMAKIGSAGESALYIMKG